MSTSIEHHALPFEQLHPSICLLRLLAERPASLDNLVLDHKETLENSAFDNPDSEEGDSEGEPEGVDRLGAEDMEERSPKVLRDKVLDRLAETLANYKSDRTIDKGTVPDSKHVSTTMMIMNEQNNSVKILCAKNEGLDQHNSTDDTEFLSS